MTESTIRIASPSRRPDDPTFQRGSEAADAESLAFVC